MQTRTLLVVSFLFAVALGGCLDPSTSVAPAADGAGDAASDGGVEAPPPPPRDPAPPPSPAHDPQEPDDDAASSAGGAPDGSPVARIDVSAQHAFPDEPVRFDASGSTGDGLSYLWEFTDDATAQGTSVERAFAAEGTHTVRLTVTGAGGASDTATAQVTVDATRYEQGVWFNWDKKDLDVVVLGIQDPLVGAAIADAIAAWESGIRELAPDLADGLEFRVHWAPYGVPPPLVQADILVVPQGFFAVSTRPCIATAPMLAGWGSMYHVAAHEFGHCLGLTHVFEDGREYEPRIDIMGGGQAGFRSCPSNLNLQVLEMVFGGQRGTVEMPASAYFQAASC